MKFQPDFLEGVNTITRHDGARLWVGAVRPWAPATFDDLTQAHFDGLLQDKPELVIFGSGARLRFPSASLLRGLIARNIGLESMDTAAACRTYNVLASEGRTVVAALLLEPT